LASGVRLKKNVKSIFVGTLYDRHVVNESASFTDVAFDFADG
jgi:hypothetical protein